MWQAVGAFLSNLGKGFMAGASSGLTGQAGPKLGSMGVSGTLGQLAGMRATSQVGPKAQLYGKLFDLAAGGGQVKTKNPATGQMGSQSTFGLF